MNPDLNTSNSGDKKITLDIGSLLSMSELSPKTPYSAEYLSLLARRGKLTAKKVDNVWYTTEAALSDYQKKQESRTQSQNNNGDNGWLSMSELAPKTPYSAEYLSLLARKKKLFARKVDNVWYTTEAALSDYQKNQETKPEPVNILSFIEPVAVAPVSSLLQHDKTVSSKREARNPLIYFKTAALALSLVMAIGITLSLSRQAAVVGFAPSQLATVSLFEAVGDSLDLFVDGWNGFKQVALDTLFAPSPKLAEKTPKAETIPETKPAPIAVTQTTPSLNTSNLKNELKAELESYIRTQLSSAQAPVTVYTTSPVIERTILREEILLADTRPSITRQSDADTNRVSSLLGGLTDGGSFTNASLTSSSFSGTGDFSTLTFTIATGTSATTTNFFSTNASSTNLWSSIANISSLTATNATSSTFAIIGDGAGLTFSGSGNHDISASAGTLRIGANTIIGNILALDDTVDIGSAATRFDKIYANEVNATTLVGTLTGGNLTAETFSINSDNATADTEDGFLAFERGSVSPNALLQWDSANDRFAFNNSLLISGNSTTTNATTTNSFATTASSTNLFSSLLSVGSSALNVIAGGNVGIGTVSPAGKLHVYGDSPVLRMEGNDSTDRPFLEFWNAGGFRSAIGMASNGTDLQFWDGSNVQMTLENGGNVGIGTTNPGAGLHVQNDNAFQATIRPTTGTNAAVLDFRNTSGDVYVGAEGSVAGNSLTGSLAYGALFGSTVAKSTQLFTDGTARLTIRETSGNVGIGTTDPTSKLHAVGTVGSGASLLRLAPDFNGSAVTAYGIHNVATDSTSSANTDYGYYGSLTLTGNAAKTARGIYQSVTTDSTTSDTIYGLDLSASASGSIATNFDRSVYGANISASISGSVARGSIFGTQVTTSFTASSPGLPSNVYGLYMGNTSTLATDSGTLTSYGIKMNEPILSSNGISSWYGLHFTVPRTSNSSDDNHLITVVDHNGANSKILDLTYGSNGFGGDWPILNMYGAAASPDISFKRGRGFPETPTVVVDGDDIGVINYYGYDGSSYRTATQILSEVDGTVTGGGAADMPGRLTFWTTPDGSATLAERMRIDDQGNVGIGTTNPGYKLDVAGPINTDQYSGYKQAGNTILTASSTNFTTEVGINAGPGLLAASLRNIAIGEDALRYATTTNDNIAIGYQALRGAGASTANTGNKNIAIGSFNLLNNTTGGSNIAIGYGALESNTTGENHAFGSLALNSNTTGTWNQAFGGSALQANTTGSRNNAFGVLALRFNTTGIDNNVFGTQAMQNNLTGNYNTAIGESALIKSITGHQNVAIGAFSSDGNQSATSTVAIGYCAASGGNCNGTAYNAQGYTVLGHLAGASFATGANYNTLIGYQAGNLVTTGASNIVLGAYSTGANSNITTGSNNIIIGNDIQAPSATASNQLNIGNLIYGTSLSGTGSTVSPGNVGIGTTTPGAKLHTLATTEQLRLGYDATNYASFTVASDGNLSVTPNTIFSIKGQGSNLGELRLYRSDQATTNIRIYTDSGSNARIDGNGGLFLDVSGGSKIWINDQIRLGDGIDLTSTWTTALTASQPIINLSQTWNAGAVAFTGHQINYTNSASASGSELFDWQIGGTTAFSLATNAANGTAGQTNAYFAGNVGIGTTNPGALLSIKSSAASAAGGIEFIRSGGTSIMAKLYETTGDANFELYSGDTEKIHLGTVADSYFNGGNVGIGTTTPQALLSLERDTTSLNMMDINNLRSGSSNESMIRFFRQSVNVGSITVSNVATAYNTSSDERLKTDILDTELGLEDLMLIQVKDYKFLSDPEQKTRTGFIAQQLNTIFPDAVTIPNNSDEFWSVDYGKLTPLLTKAIQELYTEFTQLKDTVLAFADRIVSNEIVVNNQFCFEELCINKEQFRTILENNGIISTASASSDGGAAPVPEPEPVPEPAPEPESTPETEPSSETESEAASEETITEEPTAEPETETEPTTEFEPAPDSTSSPQAEPEPEPESEPASEPTTAESSSPEPAA